MKPLYLEIEGIKSISERQKVDFERVSKSGIFGIFGKTGSGKTTILDSIVLAIYGDTTASVDNKDFVNTGCSQARVMLLFSVTGGGVTSKYRVERIYKFDKKRTHLTSSGKLWEVTKEGEYCIAENTSQVNKKLKEEIIGLSKEDFLKCIALPQGAFSEFIKLTRSERLAFIGKLFGLEKYGPQLAIKISTKDKALKSEEDFLTGQILALGDCSKENLKLQEMQLALAKEEYEKATEEKKKIEERFDTVKQQLNYIKERKAKSALYEKKLTYKSVIEQKAKEIELLDALLFIEKDIEIYAENKKGYSLGVERVKILEEEKKELENQREKSLLNQSLVAGIQEEIYTAKAKAVILEEMPSKIQLLNENRAELEKLRREYKETTDQITLCESKIETISKERENYLKKLSSYDVNGALEELSNNLSLVQMGDFASRSIDFLNRLKDLLKGKILTCESAVNRLIAQEMQRLSKIGEESHNFDVRKALSDCVAVIDGKNSCQTKVQECETQISALNEKMLALREKEQEKKQAGVKAKEECDKTFGEIEKVLLGKSLQEVKQDIISQIEQKTKRIESINEEAKSINEKLSENATSLSAQKERVENFKNICKKHLTALEKVLTERSLTLEQAQILLNDREQTEKNRVVVQNYESELSALSVAIGELNEKLQNCTLTEEEFEKEREIYNIFQDNYQFIIKKLSKINTNYEIELKKNEKCSIINQSLLKIQGERKLLSKVYELVKESRFMEFIAEVYLKEIAGEAQSRVLSLTAGRYGLCYERGNFYVADNLSGGKLRPVLSLSGGETFLVSLSLALALSSQISRRALKTLEFFFLDEGFGTLDDDLVDAVTSSLEQLQKSNLTVGLITHVTELKNRIASRIEVQGATPLRGTVITDNC